METYTFLRELADSWVLLMMTLFFLGTIAWAFRPRASATYRDIADIPFRNEDKPACPNACADCSCQSGRAGLNPEGQK